MNPTSQIIAEKSHWSSAHVQGGGLCLSPWLHGSPRFDDVHLRAWAGRGDMASCSRIRKMLWRELKRGVSIGFHQKHLLVGGLEHFLFSHISGMSSSQLTFIFFRGVAKNHQPVYASHHRVRKNIVDSLHDGIIRLDGNSPGRSQRISPSVAPVGQRDRSTPCTMHPSAHPCMSWRTYRASCTYYILYTSIIQHIYIYTHCLVYLYKDMW